MNVSKLEKILFVLRDYICSDYPVELFKSINDEGVLISKDVFQYLPDEEVGIKVLDDQDYKYKIYKVVEGITFYVYSDFNYLAKKGSEGELEVEV